MIIHAFVLVSVNFIIGTGYQSSFGTSGTIISNSMTEQSCIELKRNLDAMSEQIKVKQTTENYYTKTSLNRCIPVDLISIDVVKK